MSIQLYLNSENFYLTSKKVNCLQHWVIFTLPILFTLVQYSFIQRLIILRFKHFFYNDQYSDLSKKFQSFLNTSYIYKYVELSYLC